MQSSIYQSLQKKHLQKAISQLQILSKELQDWHIDEQLGEVERAYRFMVQYMLDGIVDPNREQIYKHLLATTYEITNAVCEKLLARDATTLYFGKKRYIANSNKSLAQLFHALDNSVSELSLCELMPEAQTLKQKRKTVELLAGNLFDHVWVNYPATSEDYATLHEALQPGHLPDAIAALLISALMLNLIHAFDPDKAEILIDTYHNHPGQEVQIRAIVALMLVMVRHNNIIPLYDKLHTRIEMLYDEPQFKTDAKSILFQLVRSRDTEKIARKLTEEVMPKMMKLSPSLYKKIKEDDAVGDIEALEQNPEWQEIIEQSGITDELKKLNELQMEGADVLMSTFAHLKSFPFFNEPANWFMPFITNHTEVTSVIDNQEWGKQFAEMILSSGFMCNSDKYSLCLSLSQMPMQQRQMMASQFSSQNQALMEQAKAELRQKSIERESISNRYIQDLYRFFNLHPHRSEFKNLLATPTPTLLQSEYFTPLMHDDKFLQLLGEYFFKNQNYRDALYIYNLLANNEFTNSELYQKMGYCHQSLGEYQLALENYLRADLIKPNHVWTLRRIATCYRNTKKTELALQYFMRAEELSPDNLSVNLNIGHCHLEQNNYDEALKYYFKVDFLDTKGTKARRPIAWCSFLAGKIDQAARYYQKIIDDSPTPLDFMNAGHVALAQNQMQHAISLYVRSIKSDNNNIENFTTNFTQDIPDLIKANINPNDIPIIYDQVIYRCNHT